MRGSKIGFEPGPLSIYDLPDLPQFEPLFLDGECWADVTRKHGGLFGETSLTLFCAAGPHRNGRWHEAYFANMETRQSGQYQTFSTVDLTKARIGPSEEATNAMAPSMLPTKFNAEL